MGTAEEIAQALDGRWEHTQWRCLCPVHGGHSLMVRESDGRPVIHCFGGCQFPDVVRELRGRGLWPESSEEAKQAVRERRQREAFDKARQIVILAHESEAEIPDRFGRDYRWARTVLKNAGYRVRKVRPEERRFEGQVVEVEHAP